MVWHAPNITRPAIAELAVMHKSFGNAPSVVQARAAIARQVQVFRREQLGILDPVTRFGTMHASAQRPMWNKHQRVGNQLFGVEQDLLGKDNPDVSVSARVLRGDEIGLHMQSVYEHAMLLKAAAGNTTQVQEFGNALVNMLMIKEFVAASQHSFGAVLAVAGLTLFFNAGVFDPRGSMHNILNARRVVPLWKTRVAVQQAAPDHWRLHSQIMSIPASGLLNAAPLHHLKTWSTAANAASIGLGIRAALPAKQPAWLGIDHLLHSDPETHVPTLTVVMRLLDYTAIRRGDRSTSPLLALRHGMGQLLPTRS